MAKLISKTYGDALYELAVEQNSVDVLAEEVASLQNILKMNEEFSKIMNHPKISKDEKLEVVDQVFKTRVSEDLMGFLRIIIINNRYAQIEQIFQYFIDKIKELRNIGTAYVTSAITLSEIQKSLIEDKLLETTQYVKMDIQYMVDASLIGGMVIRIGDRVVDSSIARKLAQMTADLTKIQLA